MRSQIIDFHTHILPGIDDGSASLEESIQLLQMEAAQGIGHVVATPHFSSKYDYPDEFLKKRDRAEALLRQEMEKHPGLPKLSIGAEVFFYRGMSESDYLPELTIRGTNCLLVEMPLTPWSPEKMLELELIWYKRGILPIIAHIDRYITPFQTYRLPRTLACLPLLVQANASFFLDKSTAKLALKMLKKDQIQLLGSDCHNLVNRKPDLGAALEVIDRKLGKDVFETICGYQGRVFENNVHN